MKLLLLYTQYCAIVFLRGAGGPAYRFVIQFMLYSKDFINFTQTLSYLINMEKEAEVATERIGKEMQKEL